MLKTILGEGDTPLVASTRIAKRIGVSRLFFKLESLNPSGSYKDRFTAAEVSRLLEAELPGCIATSSGNTGSSLATYCARYGLACAIVVNPDAPAGKLQQMRAVGAHTLQDPGFLHSSATTSRTFQILDRLASVRHIPFIVSAYRYCPAGMEHVQCIANELRAQCEDCIDHIFVPVGGGGLFTAVCRGLETPTDSHRTRVHAVQPEGCATVAASFERGDDEIVEVRSTTSISGLAVPFDIDARLALTHLRQSGGRAYALPDCEILDAQKMLLELEGIYCEPAGAAALAGLLRAFEEGSVEAHETVVCLV